jgi:hypothetical protein
MPIPGARYRWKTFPSGKEVRLAFQGNKVVEVKPKGGVAKMVNRPAPKRSRNRR